MGNLVLFAETPSAGGHGHRFLVADDFQPTETVLSAYLQAVTENISIGANFLAVRQNVAQHLENGTLRHGNEVLILAGIDMANVGPMELVNAINTLNTFLTQLRHLVTFQIDWNQTTGGGLIIGRPELGVWLQEITKLSLPTAGWRQGPQHLNTESPSGRKELGKTTSGIKSKDANVFWILVLLPFLAVSLGSNVYLYLKEPPKLDPLIETNAIETNYTAPSSHHTPSTLPVDQVSMVPESNSNKKNQALKKLDGYMETKSFDNGLKYAKDLYSKKDLLQFNSEQLAKIEDNKRIFDEEINIDDKTIILDEGTKVRVILDKPRSVLMKQLSGYHFRATDIRFDPQIRTVSKIILQPNQPVLYNVDNKNYPAYTYNQLQVVSDSEQSPPASLVKRKDLNTDTYTINRIIEYKVVGKKKQYLVSFKGYKKISDRQWYNKSALLKIQQIPKIKELIDKFNLENNII